MTDPGVSLLSTSCLKDLIQSATPHPIMLAQQLLGSAVAWSTESA